jgi:hypothetical protein
MPGHCHSIEQNAGVLAKLERTYCMVDIRVRSCCHDELLDDETPLENAVTTHKRPVVAEVSFGEEIRWG